jgi:ribosomal protein L31
MPLEVHALEVCRLRPGINSMIELMPADDLEGLETEGRAHPFYAGEVQLPDAHDGAGRRRRIHQNGGREQK